MSCISVLLCVQTSSFSVFIYKTLWFQFGITVWTFITVFGFYIFFSWFFFTGRKKKKKIFHLFVFLRWWFLVDVASPSYHTYFFFNWKWIWDYFILSCTIHIFFFFLLFSSSPVRSSHAPQSLNRVWEKRETWGLKVRFYLMCRSPHLLSNVGFRLSSSAVSRRSTRLLRKSPLCFVSHGMFGCVWNLWCVFEPCRLFLYVCMALCSCAALLAWHICILVELIPPKKTCSMDV